MRTFLTRCCLIATSLLPLLVLKSSAQPGNKIISAKLALPPLDSTAKGLHWRLWSPEGWCVQSVIQIDRSTNGSFSGKVVLYAEEAVDVEKELPTGRIYSKVTKMTPSQAVRIANYLARYRINAIPANRNIDGWNIGDDGAIFDIEYVDANHYHWKSYWTPSEFPDVKEAVAIQRMIDYIDSILILNKRVKQFSNQIPFESWVSGIVINSRDLSEANRLKYKQERNSYRKRMHIADKP